MGSYIGLKWTTDASGRLVMPELQSEFLDWLISDRKDPPKERDWAEQHGVPWGTVKKWRQDRRFKEQWERRAVEHNVSPERLQRVLDVLYDSATGTGDVAAAKQYLLYTEKLSPPKQVRRDASVSHLSDAELVAEVQGILAAGFGTEGGPLVVQLEDEPPIP